MMTDGRTVTLMGDKRTIPNSRLIFVFLLGLLGRIDALQATECENGHEKHTNTFSWADYVVLASMLIISCGIGLFYGFIGSKHKNCDDFLLGGSSMGTFPMAMSLAASFVTAIELLGNPAEMYYHGTQFLMICCAFVVVVPITSRFYLPVYMKLRLTSTYEYLALRFNAQTRYLASGFYIFQMVLYTSVAVYAPALALSNVTGLNVYVAVTVVYVVCIFYASQGGMKAVIIADTFQTGVLIGSLVLIIFLGEKIVGDTGTIWSSSYNTERLELFNLNPNPTIRHSFWSVVFGGSFYWMTMFCSNQASIQKYLSVENISQVRAALWTSCFGLIFIYIVNFYTGMIMVAYYRGCDPIKSGEINGSDEILPFFILTQMGQLKGVTGFFVAGIFAASLGTVASALNSLSAVTIQDFLNGMFKIELNDKNGAFTAKCISIVYGAISFALVFIVAQLGSVMQVAISFNGMVGGVTLGMFSLGMFFPWANSKGVIIGSLVAVALITTMCIGQQIAITNGSLVEQEKSVSVENCPCLNATIFIEMETQPDLNNIKSVPFLFKISYIWYSAIGFLVTVIIGMIVSLLTGIQNPRDLDSDLLSPVVLKFFNSLSDKMKKILNLPETKESVSLKGVANKGLDMTSENYVKPVRKVSAPS